MWGRLDGAERIIAALLPTPAQDALRRELTRQAHAAIIREEAEIKINLAEEYAQEVFDARPDGERDDRRDLSLKKKVDEAISAMRAGRDCEPALAEISRGAASLSVGSRWRGFLESFVTEFGPFSREFVVPVARGGADVVELFKKWFNAQYAEGRQLTADATLDSAVRINRVLGGMALGYFPGEGQRSFKQKLLIWLGERAQIFTEAAIRPGSDAYRKMRFRLTVCFLISLLLITGFFFIDRTQVWTAIWTAVMFYLAVTLLLLTTAYAFLWRKVRGTLAGILPKS
jgi:hypothetical protein